MLKFFREILGVEEQSGNYSSDSISSNTQERKIKLATCALFLEVAQSDEHLEKNEKEVIVSTMKNMFNLNDEEASKLIQQSDEQVKRSVSLYEFTDVINKHFDKSQKYKVIKNLWKLIFADKNLSELEEHFIRTINNNLNLEHADFIASKMEVKAELGI